MANIPENLGEIGTVPNSTTYHGAINGDTVRGVTTSAWNVRSGGTSKTVYSGNQDDITAIGEQCQAEGYEYTITGGKLWKIEITYPVDIIVNTLDNEPSPIPTWELSYKQQEQPLFRCNDRLFVSLLNAQDRSSIENKLKDPDATTPLKSVDSKASATNVYKDILAPYTAYNLKMAGVEGKSLFVPTLKRTIVTSNNYNPNYSSQYNNQLFTKLGLLSYLDSIRTSDLDLVPTGIRQAMPEFVMLNTLNSDGTSSPYSPQVGFPAFNTDVYDFVTYVGYLQMPSTVQSLGLNKLQWTTEWIFNKWSAGSYGLYDVANVFTNNSTVDMIPLPANITT